MTRVALGFLWKWIARDDVLPFIGAANEEVRLKTKTFPGFSFQ